MREDRDVVRPAPSLPCAGEPTRQIGDPQVQPAAEPLLKLRRRPFDQPGAISAAYGEGVAVFEEGSDGVVADLADVESLQQRRRRALQGGLRVQVGHGFRL